MVVGCLLLPGLAQAQIFVDPNNNVGIGTSLPLAKLEVYATPANGNGMIIQTLNSGTATTKGLTNTIGMYGTGSRFGVYNTVFTTGNSTGKSYGLYSSTNANKVEGYGLYNLVSQSSTAVGSNIYGVYTDLNAIGYGTSAYGEYTDITNTSTNTNTRYGNYITVLNGTGPQYGINVACFGNQALAGSFNGDVLISGNLINLADARINFNVQPIQGALGMLRQLAPRSYEHHQNLGLALPAGKNFGFIAQDLEKVLPELVAEELVPIDPAIRAAQNRQTQDAAREKDEPHSPPSPELVPYKSVNYTQLIPILTQAVQELAEKVDAQAATIAAQAATIESLRTEIRNQ